MHEPAASVVEQPLGKFYDLLDDEQEARLDAIAEDRRKMSAVNRGTGAPAQGCGAAQPAAQQWPADEVEARLHPNDAQRAALQVLQNANARAADLLNNACQPEDATTLPTRLDAVEGRLDALQQAVELVKAALEDFYGTLSDEQRARFEAIGQKRTRKLRSVAIARSTMATRLTFLVSDQWVAPQHGLRANGNICSYRVLRR